MMQLILETQPTEVFDRKMSTQTENSVNGDISDMKKEIIQANKENNPTIVASIENIVRINKHINSDNNQTSRSDENTTSVDNGDVNYALTNEQCSTLELPVSNVLKIGVSNDVVSKESLESSNSDTDATKTKRETKYSSEEKDTLEVINELSSEKPTEMLNVTIKELINVTESEVNKTIDEEINGDLISTADNSSLACIKGPVIVDVLKMNTDNIMSSVEINDIPVVPADIALSKETDTLPDEIVLENKKLTTMNIQPSEIPTDITKNNREIFSTVNVEDVEMVETMDKTSEITADITISSKVDKKNEILATAEIEDVEMVEIADKSSNISVDYAMSNKAHIITDNTILENEKLETITEINAVENIEEIDKLSALPEDIVMNNEDNTLAEDKIIDHVNVAPNDNKHHEFIAVHEDTKSFTDTDKENQLVVGPEEPKAITMHDKQLKTTIEETLKNDVCISAPLEKPPSESNNSDQKQLPVIEESLHIAMAEPTAILSINDNTSTNKTEELDNKIIENSVNTLQENEKPVVCATETCDEKGLGQDVKEIENVSMETDDVEIVNLDNEKQDKGISDIFSKEVHSKEDSNDPSVDIRESEPIAENTVHKNKIEQDIISKDVGNKDGTKNLLENTSNVPSDNEVKELVKEDLEKIEILDEDDVKIVENKPEDSILTKLQEKQKSPEKSETKTLPVVCKLSNTLDILSDDEEEPKQLETNQTENSSAEKQCINIEDDDDIMLIEEDSGTKEATKEHKSEGFNDDKDTHSNPNNTDDQPGETETPTTYITDLSPKINEKDLLPVNNSNMELDSVAQTENMSEKKTETAEKKTPLLPQNFLKTAKKNLADMTREELEDFCILRIVESIVDRSNLSDIKTKIKTMAHNLEDYKKRAMMLTKQNRDLQVVLKSVQEEQKKRIDVPIQPLKITRSVGMQVLMNEKIDCRRKGPIPCQPSTVPVIRPARTVQNTKVNTTKSPSIPVPRKVPVNISPAKSLTSTPAINVGKTASPTPNGLRNPSPMQKVPEKRTRMQANPSIVDLTDDEPPPKINNKSSPIPPVRVVPPQNLMANQQRPFSQTLNNPRKVYIPISGPPGQTIRPGQTLMMKSVPSPGPRPRLPTMPRMPQSQTRGIKQVTQRHPAPLPDAMKQYTPPTWKPLPPAPDLKLSKVENGIVISWKIDGYPEAGYEMIASYQLYAYQETSAPPCTALWKKIGDVKALPLPMACTLTQFMAGFKYYFAVRAVDIRSRLGPFSLPGSILLLNKA